MDSDANIERVLLWMVSGLGGADLENACIAKLEVDPAQVKGVIAEARKRLTLAAEYNRDEMLGTSLTRLNDLYSRCIRSQNEAKALDVQKEINRVAGLHRDRTTGSDDGQTSIEAEELEAIRAVLLPLNLAGEEYPLREHVRLAVERIRELEATAPDSPETS